jgi:hypothetical protein
MRTTSIGILAMSSPLSENITKIVNNNAIKVMGLILGIKDCSYHALPLSFIPANPSLWVSHFPLPTNSDIMAQGNTMNRHNYRVTIPIDIFWPERQSFPQI